MKQANLLSRIEKLDETCKELVVQLGENEEEIENLTEENSKQLEELNTLKGERTSHVQRIQQLEVIILCVVYVCTKKKRAVVDSFPTLNFGL